MLHIGRMEFAAGAFGSNLARCPPEPHHALRELCVGHVVCAGEQRRQPQRRVRLCEPDGDGKVRRRKALMQLNHRMLQKLQDWLDCKLTTDEALMSERTDYLHAIVG